VSRFKITGRASLVKKLRGSVPPAPMVPTPLSCPYPILAQYVSSLILDSVTDFALIT